MHSREETVFVSWISFHGRSDGLARRLGIEAVFIDGGEGSVLRRYARQWKATVAYLRRSRPRQVIVMQPPVVALLAVRFALRGRPVRIVGDLHTGAFVDPKWAWALRWVLRLIRHDGLVLVTNEALMSRVQEAGYEAYAVHDLIESIDAEPAAGSRSRILVPLAYAHDEPLQQILDAASKTPHIEWRLTGRAPQWMREGATANVNMLGYLPNAEYWKEVREAGAIAALTTEEETMQRAGYEALTYGKALVTTKTRVLQEYFDSAAVYVATDANDLAEGVSTALSAIAAWEARMQDLRASKLAVQDDALGWLANYLFNEGGQV